MDAATLTPDDNAELAALRRRAYSPDADIHRDAAALARLQHLEQVTRAADTVPPASGAASRRAADASAVVSVGRLWSGTTVPDAAASDTAAEDATVVPDVVEGAVAESGGSASVGDADRSPRSGDHSMRTFLRRTAWWWVLVAVGAVVGAAVLLAIAPRPHAVLHPNDDVIEVPDYLEDRGLRDYLGVAPDAEFVRYDPFAGTPVWVVPTATGGRCIVLGGVDSGFDFGCGLGDLEPMLDTIVDRGFLTAADAELPAGSIVRFILRGDAIDVWLAEAAAPAA